GCLGIDEPADQPGGSHAIDPGPWPRHPSPASIVDLFEGPQRGLRTSDHGAAAVERPLEIRERGRDARSRRAGEEVDPLYGAETRAPSAARAAHRLARRAHSGPFATDRAGEPIDLACEPPVLQFASALKGGHDVLCPPFADRIGTEDRGVAAERYDLGAHPLEILPACVGVRQHVERVSRRDRPNLLQAPPGLDARVRGTGRQLMGEQEPATGAHARSSSTGSERDARAAGRTAAITATSNVVATARA